MLNYKVTSALTSIQKCRKVTSYSVGVARLCKMWVWPDSVLWILMNGTCTFWTCQDKTVK